MSPLFALQSKSTGTVDHDVIDIRASKRRRAGLLATLVALAAMVALGTGVSAASAAPVLDVAVSGSGVGPNDVPLLAPVPGESGVYEVLVKNSGDVAIADNSVTVEVAFPEEVFVTSVSGGQLGANTVYACTVSSDEHHVSCTGPNAFGFGIPPGNDACAGTGFAPECPIRIEARAGNAEGEGALTVEACGGGAPDCGSASLPMTVHDFGDRYGMAPINRTGAETVPAIPARAEPDANKAFWAGSCDRVAAPAFGVPISPPGFGPAGRPSSIWAPAGEDDNNLPANRIAVPAPATAAHCIDLGEPSQYRTFEAVDGGIWFEEPDWRLPAFQQAGSRPDGSSTMAWQRNAGGFVDGAVDNIYVDLPPGFVGNPNGIEKCTQEEFAAEPPKCSPASQVGILHLLIQGVAPGGAGHGPEGNYKIYPVWNLEPRKGRVAELGFGYASGESAVSVRVSAKARTNGDFGVTAFTGQIPAALSPVMQTITLWGVPWDSANDLWRAPKGLYAGNVGAKDPCTQQAGVYQLSYIPHSGFSPSCQQGYQPSWGSIKPFLTQETDCSTDSTVKVWTDAFQNPGDFTSEGDPSVADSDTPGSGTVNPGWKTATSAQDAVTGCEELDFAPNIEFGTSTSAADGATGLSVDLSIPQNNDLPFGPPAVGASQSAIDAYVDQAAAYWKSNAGLATAHLKDTVVTLPPGVSVNPSTATGLVGCDDATIGVREQGNPPLFDNSDPTDGLDNDDCPDGSRIGTVEVKTPLLDETLTGEVILGTPKSTDPQSGEMFRMFLVLRSKERGLIAKVYGSAKADPSTGRLTARFENNPEVPFNRLQLEFKGGSKGLLAMPQRCGAPAWSASFTPWSSVGAPVSVPDVPDGGAFGVDADCAFGFGPTLQAGMDTSKARSNGTFSFQFTRPQGQQSLRGLTAKLPTGLLASVKDLPLCSDAAANAGSCPAASKIGIVDAKAGSGDPFVLEEKGEVFLTEGYKGGEYGLAVKIRPIAGPFRGAMELSPIVVRQAIHVDRKTAQVTAVSDPFPLIHHGVPLRVREVTVLVNRGNFMLNPSDCAAKQIGANLVSDQGANANLTNAFQAAGCASLAFKPRLALRLTGRKQVRTGKHPGIRATVTQQGIPEAGIEKAEVRLPKSLALDVDNAQALCEFDEGTKPDLENHCPKGSIVGRARAVSPLLNDPLVGNVYFVKNVRRSSSGNLIRTLPMIVVALRGEIAVNLIGESNVKKGKLVNTFDDVPDAPITRFNLNIKGGKNGIIAVTRTRRALINLCSGRHVAETDMDGHNGRRHDSDIRIKTPCTKKQTKAAKRNAKRAAAKARAGGNRRR